MSKLILTFLILALALAYIGSWLEGEGGMLSTALQNNLSTTSNQLTMNTNGWLDSDVIQIDAEYMTYASKDATHLYGLTRGVYGTRITTHRSGAQVYSQAASDLNTALGFNIGAVSISNGIGTIAIVPFKFFTVTLPAMINSTTNSPIFTGDLAIISYVFLAAGVSFYIVIAMTIGVAFSYALRR